MPSTLAYTKDSTVFIPEVRLTSLEPADTAVPLRGYAHVLAVLRDGACIGWIVREDLPAEVKEHRQNPKRGAKENDSTQMERASERR